MRRQGILLLVILQAILIMKIEAIQHYEDVDTATGFCDTVDFGRIPLGGVAYNSTHCSRASCMDKRMSIEMCDVLAPPQGCVVIPGPGDHPECCLIAKCD